MAKKAAKAEKTVQKQNEKEAQSTKVKTTEIENVGVENSHPTPIPSRQELKLAKATEKGKFSRARNQLSLLLDNGESTENEIVETRNKVRINFNSYMQSLVTLLENTEKNEENVTEIENYDREILRAEEEIKELFQRLEQRNENVNQPRKVESTRYELRSRREDDEIREISEKTRQRDKSPYSEFAEENMSQVSSASSRTRISRRGSDVPLNQSSLLSKRDEFAEIERAQYELDDLYRQRRGALDTKLRELRISSPTPSHILQETPLQQKPMGWMNRNIESRRSLPNYNEQPEDLGMDLLKQLKRVPIPVFYGDKRHYASWKAAFYSCVDAANVTPEYKLLQLRSYLRGEALKSIELFGHSAEAYEASKRQLERKFGGERRQMAIRMEELDQFKPIRPGHPKEVEKLADLLEVLVVTMKDSGRTAELGDGTLYMKIQKKLNEEMLTKYKRWSYEKDEPASVESLKKWLLRESDYQNQAAETLRGLIERPPRPKNETTYLSSTQPSTKMKCAMCSESHPIWTCPSFAYLNSDERWDVAKNEKLCFCCLASTHRSRDCLRAQVCGINNCTKNHSKLLHPTEIIPDHQTHHVLAVNSTPFITRNSNNPFLNPSLGAEVKPSDQISPPDDPSNTQIHPSFTTHAPAGSQAVTTDISDFRIPTSEEHTHNNNTGGNTISLRTIPVFLENGNPNSKRRVKVNALLDDGSTRTYVNSDVSHELGVVGEPNNISVGVLGGRSSMVHGEEVNLKLVSFNGKFTHNISAQTTTKVTGSMKAAEWPRSSQNWSHLAGIDFPEPSGRKTIDILIGADHIGLHTSLKEICGEPGAPIARLTPLGWTCVGRVEPRNLPVEEEIDRSFLCADTNCEEFQLEKFWEVENIPQETQSTIHMSQEEEDAVKIAKVSLKENEKRFQLRAPWKMLREGMPEEYYRKNNIEEIPNNYKEAYKRLVSTEKSIIKKGVEKQYNEIFEKYEEKQYIKKVSGQDRQKTKWLLPHFPILRFDKETTKIRAVFDGSATYNGVSLNDFALKGPKLQKDVFTILCRMRRKPIAVVCDISEMYLQIEIAPEDRKYFRFLWRNLQDKSPDVYEFSRLVFGFTAGPFLAQFVTRENAIKNQEELPLASASVFESTYMDDTLDSVEDEETAIQFYHELKELWGRAGMVARKWLSNSENVLKEIPEDERAASVDLENSELPVSKTLGLRWMSKEDFFTYISKLPESRNFSKRTFLSLMAAVFDPLGFLSPFIIKAKIIMQELWLEGLNWDDKLPLEINGKLQRWCDDLEILSVIRIPRCVRLSRCPISMSLHLFSDASKEAMATVAYARTKYESGDICVRLIASKSKVAPLRVTSIPRLELMGATMSVRLASILAPIFEVQEQDVYYWTDSMNVLWWISRRSKTLKTFVANRVGVIHRGSKPHQWRHVSGKTNPADLASRGTTIEELEEAKIWWNGPDFLNKEPNEWPEKLAVAATPSAKKEESQKWKNLGSTFHVRTLTLEEESRLNPNRYSKFNRLVRVTAWVVRFISNCRSKRSDRIGTELSVEELRDSELSIIQSTQEKSFQSEFEDLRKEKKLSNSSPLITFHPFVDDDQVLRANSRLANAEFLTYDIKYPIILPRREWVTKLIIRSYHSTGEHAKGTNHTLAELSEKYIIPQAREEIRSTEAECNYCKKKKAKPASQIMAPLPRIRLKQPLHAFNKMSVDFGGPFQSIQGRGRRRAKRYLCLFTCLQSRAVHLELAYSLDTDSFLNAFYRMTSRRGLPEEAVSDNGSNFVSGNRELQELVQQLDDQKIQSSLANRGVKWHFNPPLAPNFGGVHEAMIKAAKRAISAVLHNADINDEELHTTFVGVEDLLNSRPITYQSSHPADDLPLTPNHFLHGRVGGEFAPETVDTVDFVARKRWRRVQELVRHVWSRWLREWVPELRRRNKWQHATRDFVVGDLVLIIDINVPRGRWNMGKIDQVYPGRDGRVRTVTVKTCNGTYVRAVTKLCHLELSSV